MAKAQIHPDSIYLYDKTGKYYTTEATRIKNNPIHFLIKKDTSVTIILADFRTLNNYLQITLTGQLTDAEMLTIKINLPSILKRIMLKIDSIKIIKKH